MNIKKIQINGYGKLKDISFQLNKGINIIQGDNESGKSTLLNYITSSFYGISKNKKGKEMSDFEKYKPWEGEEFSGKLTYELDNSQQYEIFRDFRKKNPKIFNEKLEDVSKEFNIDKTKGNEFFYEQTNVDEDLFKSTVLVNQQEVKLDNNNQHMLIQKISNLVGSGEDNVSYKLAMDRLNRKLLDEVGTVRSREKPINILTKQIEELENKKEELKEYKDIKYEIEEKNEKIRKEIEELEDKNIVAKKLKIIRDKQIIEDEKIKIQENLLEENENKINKLNIEIDEIENEEKNILRQNKKIKNKMQTLNKRMIFLFLIIIILNILQFIFIKNKIINCIFLLTAPMILIYFIFSKNKLKNKIDTKNIENIKNEKNKIKNEIEIINENKNKIKNELKNIQEKNNLEINLETEQLKNKYQNFKDIFMEKNIEIELENIQNEINQKELKIHKHDLEKENIEPQLDNLSKLEENLVNYKEQYVNIKAKERSIELAKEVLTNSYQKMKEKVTPKFTKQLSENIAEITNSKYSKAMYNEDKGLIIEIKNGSYVTASKLSIGTIDQLYLSLRLSMIDDLSEEKLPIILDESFAYFDTKRLVNILKYLSKKYSNRQIIIFTCTNREKEILEKLNINFNYINL